MFEYLGLTLKVTKFNELNHTCLHYVQWCRVDQWIPEVFDERNIQELYRHVIQKVITNKDGVY